MPSMRAMSVVSIVLLLVTLPAVLVAAQLPPEIQADRYLMQAERAVSDQDFLGAKTAMDAVLELQERHDLELPDQFSFRYAEVLDQLGLYEEAVRYVTEYLNVAGRDGKYYRDALELLDSAEETYRRLQAERQLADAARRQAEAEQQKTDELVRRQLEAAAELLPQDPIRSGGRAPQMVKIASGQFQYLTWQRGQHLEWVEFDAPYAISRYEVTRGDFERFVESSRYRTDAERGSQCDRRNASWKRPQSWNETPEVPIWDTPKRFRQRDDHPVVCVSPRDAMAYAEWLSTETGRKYRIPSWAEWQYAARAGSEAARLHLATPWETDIPLHCGRANLDEEPRQNCTDGIEYTARVGRFPPNDIGLHDMIGNVSEWVLACRHVVLGPNGYRLRGRRDGAPENPDSCEQYVASAGDAYYHAGNPETHAYYGSSHYIDMTENGGGASYVGFRVVLELENGQASP